MKKNQIFNLNIYLEGLRQSYLLGVLLTVLATILNCIPDLDGLQHMVSFAFNNQNDVYKEQYFKNFNSMMNYLTIAVPFIMGIYQFKFLNNRKACDFYHALPIKRSTLFINFSLASITSIVIAMILPVLANTFIYSLSEYNIIDYRFLLPVILDYIIVSLLAFSTILLGLSLTHNPIPATFVALIVLILPRYSITQTIQARNVVSNMFFDGIPLFTDIFGNYNNLFYKKITNFFDTFYFSGVVYLGTNSSTLYAQDLDYTFFSYIYTSILALAIFSLACFVFVKRKSEIATSATTNKLVNNILKILFVLPSSVMLINSYFIYGSTTDSYTYYMYTGSWNNLTVYPWIISIILIFFIYELLITRSFKSLIKVVPVFLIVIVINLGFYFMVDTSINVSMENSQIDKNDITSVSLDFYDPDYFVYYDTYTRQLLKDYKITDPDIIELVHSALNDSLKSNNTIGFSEYKLYAGFTTINTNNSSIKRFFPYSFETMSEVASILKLDEYVKNTILTTLPDKEDVHIVRATSFGKNYDVETAKVITDTFYQEYNSLSVEQQSQSLYVADVSRFDINFLEDYNATPTFSEYMYIENLQNELRYDQYNTDSYKATVLYDFDTELNKTLFKDLPSYNSNDMYSYLALYTIEGYGKYIKLNENFPNTKKLLVDLFINENKGTINDFVNNTLSSIDNNYYFAITSLEDSYSALSQPTTYLANLHNPNTVEYDEELVAFIRESATRINQGNIDYDNIYFINFYRSSSYVKLLLPITEQEYEKYLLNISDYVATWSQGVEIALDYFGQPDDYRAG